MMPQAEYSTPSRADQLWRHLSGLFGAEALKRKFGTRPPAEWDGALRSLSDAQIANGVDRLLNSGSEHIPSLPQFLALCRQAREFEDRSGYERLPAKRYDKWDMAGNRHLLAYVLKAGFTEKRRFDEAKTRTLVAYKNAWVEDMRSAETGEEGMPVEAQKAAWEDCMQRAAVAMALAKAA
jgi:hypothetical protein